jgi:hypothetical protein
VAYDALNPCLSSKIGMTSFIVFFSRTYSCRISSRTGIQSFLCILGSSGGNANRATESYSRLDKRASSYRTGALATGQN